MKSFKKLLNVFKRQSLEQPVETPTPSFPFFRLPILVQLLILKQLDLLEIIDFSFLSQRSKTIIQSLNLQLLKFNWSLDCRANRHYIHLEDSYHHEFHLAVPSYPNDPTQQLGNLDLNGAVLPVGRHYDIGWGILGIRKENLSNRERLEVMDQLTAHLLEVFTVENLGLTLICFRDTVNCFIWKHAKRFTSLTVSGDRQLTKNEIRFIMEELIVTDSLFVRNPVTPKYEYSGPLKMSRISVDDGCWLTLVTILNMDCTKFYANTTSLTCEDLNVILRTWLGGGMKNLMAFSIIKFNPIPRASLGDKMNRILKEITPWGAFVPRQESRNIRRRDGIIATVQVLNELFLFYLNKDLNK